MKEYENLKKIREARGYSVKDIAIALGATTRQVKRWESGRVKMKTHKYIILAKFYNLSLDYITGIINIPLELK